MNNILLVITIVVGIVLIALTLLQGKGRRPRGVHGVAWGGNFQTRRGLEKWMLKITAVLVFVFFILSVVALLQ
ncbi:MAG: preprotein translocase subunit SecG [Microgenomates bacterium OLB23]|nr:MAG: preprotein translocase subunit SecG [Microgenomates bacterium OLB23]